MIKTYEIDFDDELVCSATKIFEELGTNIDTAINIFLKQAVLRKGFPFEVAIPEEKEVRSEELGVRSFQDSDISGNRDSETENDSKNEPSETLDSATSETEGSAVQETESSDDLHAGITEEEENATGVAEVPAVSPDIAARVAANEALVEQMRNEIGDKNVTPEFDENEEEQLAVSNEQCAVSNESPETENGERKTENALSESESSETKNEPSEIGESATPETESAESSEESEDEDETTPDNLFVGWDVGEEEDIGCR